VKEVIPFVGSYPSNKRMSIKNKSYSFSSRCRNRRTQEEFAVKIVSQRQEVDTQNEIELLRLCQGHANIVKLHEVFTDELHTYIIMELLTGGELFYRIRTQASFSEKEASQLMKKLVSAVNFMHSNDLCHRDLKPEVREISFLLIENSFFFLEFVIFISKS